MQDKNFVDSLFWIPDNAQVSQKPHAYKIEVLRRNKVWFQDLVLDLNL